TVDAAPGSAARLTRPRSQAIRGDAPPERRPLGVRNAALAAAPEPITTQGGNGLVGLRAPAVVKIVSPVGEDDRQVSVASLHAPSPRDAISCHASTRSQDAARRDQYEDVDVPVGAAVHASTPLYSESFDPCVPVVARFPNGDHA